MAGEGAEPQVAPQGCAGLSHLFTSKYDNVRYLEPQADPRPCLGDDLAAPKRPLPKTSMSAQVTGAKRKAVSVSSLTRNT